MKKLVLLFMLVLMFGITSAATWDDRVSYKAMEYTITNAFGFGDEIAKIKLKTPHNNVVGAGYTKVAEIEIKNGEKDWDSIIEEIQLFNIGEDGSLSEFDRKIDIKMRSEEIINIYDYSCAEIVLPNESISQVCTKELVDTKKKKVWVDFNNSLIKNKKIILGLFTEVRIDDHVEWIPVIYGHALDKWAVWTADLNVGLMAYYDFDNSTAAQIDLIDNTGQGNDGALTNMENSDWVPGILGFSLDFDGTNEFVSLGNLSDKPNEYSLSFWVNMDDHLGVQAPLVSANSSGSDASAWGVKFRNVGNNIEVFVSNNTNGNGQVGIVADNNGERSWNATNYPVGTWVHFVTVVNTTNITYYHNGTLINAIPRTILENTGEAFNMSFGQAGEIAANRFDGQIDEAGIWNRSLTAAEVTQLYNGGAAITFQLPTTPSVTLISPANNFETTDGNITFLCFVQAPVNISNVSFILDGVINQTNTTGTNATNYSFNKAIDFGDHNWTCSATNNISQTTNATLRNFSVNQFAISSETFDAFVFETSHQFFELNISTIASILSVDAMLNYNGIRHIATTQCTAPNCQIDVSIDIPLVNSTESQNRSFFWELTVFDGSTSLTQNTSEQVQNTTRIHLEQCGGAPFTIQTANFSAFDETTLIQIDPFTFDGTFLQWLGTGTFKRNSSISDNATSVELCITPTESTFFLSGQIDYDEGTFDNYTARNYFFDNDIISNTSQSIPLGLLKSEDATTFILRVQDENLLSLANVSIFIQRFYPGEGIFRTVQVARTNQEGRTLGFFKTETIDYRFILKRQGVTELITEAGKIVGESVPFTITFTLGEFAAKPWADFEQLEDLNTTLTFNQTSEIVTWTYLDTSGNFSNATLLVLKQNFSSANTISCNFNSTQSSATITCNLSGNISGTYIATGFITRDITQSLVAQIVFEILPEDTLANVSGNLGLFLGWFLILVSVFAFKFNEIAGIILTNLAIIFVNLIHLVNFGITAITAIAAISLIIIVVLER